jgi:hypothetical protein
MAENQAMPPPPPAKIRVRSWFVYPVPAVTVAPAAQGNSTVQIDAATNFYWVKTSFWADNNAGAGGQTAATRIIPAIDVQITVTGADKNLFNARVPVGSIAGTGELPYVLPFPMLLAANSQINFEFLSREAANTIRLVMALHGWKDYGELTEG